MTHGTDTGTGQRIDVDVIVVGAGFAGLYMVHRLVEQGRSVQGFEAAGGVGGTWWWNRYPGARCDIESFDYSYSFSAELEQDWTWTERYASQPEILAYLDHVADRFDLRRHFRFDTRVTSLTWDDAGGFWIATTDAGDVTRSRWCVMATGCLSAATPPDIPDLERFTGEVVHTATWPHEGVDVTDRRVAVIGTGSSGIQCVPVLAESASRLHVYQRTAAFTVPAHNTPISPDEATDVKAHYRERREANRAHHGGVVVVAPEQAASVTPPEQRAEAFEAAWGAGALFSLLATFNDLFLDPDANETAAEFVRGKIREIVNDPDVADRLCPTAYPIGTKRLCLDTGYYDTFNHDHVTLVDLRDTPIVEVAETGIRTTVAEHSHDVIVLATGFDAMTGALLAVDIRGRGGVALTEAWADGPRTFLGLMVAGFPNLFTVTGPGSPSVLTNMAVSIEHHVEWISDCIGHMVEHDRARIEPHHDAQESWTDHVTEIAGYTLFPRAGSWYTGANVTGKPRVFMPYIAGFPAYRAVCDQVVGEAYRGFVLS